MKCTRLQMGGRRNSVPRVGDPFGIGAHQLAARGNGEKVAVVLPDGRSASGQYVPSRIVLPQANPGQRRTTMGHSSYDPVEQGPAWNAGRKLGAKRPLKPKEIWEIRFMLDREHRLRDRALFDLAIDSKLRDAI